MGFENSNMIEQFHNIVVLLPFTRESRHDSGNSNDPGETLADSVFNENICKIGHISCPWQQLSRLFNWTIKETLHSVKHKKVAPNVF